MDRVTRVSEDEFDDLVNKIQKTQENNKTKNKDSEEWKDVYKTIEAQNAKN